MKRKLLTTRLLLNNTPLTDDGVVYKIFNGTAHATGSTGTVSWIQIANTYQGLPVTSTAHVTGFTGTASRVQIAETYKGLPVTSIDEDAFNKCEYIREIVIPDSVTRVKPGAFNNCVNLIKVTLCNLSQPWIFDYDMDAFKMTKSVFDGCKSLTTIILSDNAICFDPNLFGGCPKLRYNIYKGIKYIGSATNAYFAAIAPVKRKSTSYKLHDHTKVIMNEAFSTYRNLSSITIPNNVEHIGNNAFYFCSSLTNITIPSNVSSIGSYAFATCKNLQSITFENTTNWYRTSNIDDFANKTNGTLIDVSNPTANVELFKYPQHYFYKK